MSNQEIIDRWKFVDQLREEGVPERVSLRHDSTFTPAANYQEAKAIADQRALALGGRVVHVVRV